MSAPPPPPPAPRGWALDEFGSPFNGKWRTHTAEVEPRDLNLCRVYWGSHGCDKPRGHEGQCACDCGFGSPYYGAETRFYGEDVRARGLPHIEDD